jgi:gluconolactonase
MSTAKRERIQGEATMENSRREIMAGACAAAAINFSPAALAAWEPSQRYPDPAIQSLDPLFNKYRLALAGVERRATGCRFNEGAVYFGDARCLLWSDIPNNRIMRWDEETGRINIFRQPSNHANGNTRDRQVASSLASIKAVASRAPSMTAPSRC